MIRVRVPPSKSVTQRALVLAALSDRPCLIREPLDCDDSRAMRQGLAVLGVRTGERGDDWLIEPPSQLVARDARVDLGNAGTAVRFITALSALVEGSMVIDGNDAMRRRPMPGLLDAMRQLGVEVQELGHRGCPPVGLVPSAQPRATGGPARARLTLGGSSQELSALLLAGCRMTGGLRVRLEGSPVSRPYIDVTRAVLVAFGVRVEHGDSELRVEEGVPRCDEYAVEADWSSASYPLAAGWLTGQAVEVVNLRADSPQGDRVCPRLLAELDSPGARHFDMGDVPDLVPTMVACALFARKATRISGVSHLRIKETNRLEALVSELAKLGAGVRELEDGLLVEPAALRAGATLDAHDDHRLAMAFGLVSLRVPRIEIAGRDCVSKSYPDYWQMLERFR